MKLLRVLTAIVGLLLAFMAALWAYQAWPVALPPRPERFELIAHRGVHHDFDLAGVTSTTCTAERIDPPEHGFIENTLPSMEEAFRSGATVVELDLHTTTDNRLVVFHDWEVGCRTEGEGETRAHTLAELQALDVGYGYTADGGRTFPLRGSGVGMMPTLEQVLETFPDQRLLLNPKDDSERMVALLSDALSELPEGRRQLALWWGAEPSRELRDRVPEVSRLLVERPSELRACAAAYARRLGIGALPEPCRAGGLAIPAEYLGYLPGWPDRFLRQAHDGGVRVYVETDDLGTALEVARLPIDGIMTDRIEVLGPAVLRELAAAR